MKIVVFGASGQLGLSLRDTEPTGVAEVIYADRRACDLLTPGAVRDYLNAEAPDLVINAAAYTAVDQAEEEPELAARINRDAVREMAEWVSDGAGRLIHISTDFVFDGRKTVPYLPGDETAPLGEYGKSKLRGELAALQAAPEQTTIIRTAWVYSEHGSNFVKTMLRLMAEREELGVVGDQRGSPTYARGLAEIIWLLVTQDLVTPGIFHWADAGDISWWEFARAIQEEAIETGILERAIPVNEITTADYPTPAERPAYSVLDTGKLARRLGVAPVAWREHLRAAMGAMP